MHGMSDASKLLAAYILTSPHANGLGCFLLPYEYVQADLKWPLETVSKAFVELFENGFCKRCERTDFVFLPKYLAWNPVTNLNVGKAREKDFLAIPSKFSYFNELIDSMKRFGNHWPKGFETMLENRLANPFETRPDPTRPDPSQKNPSQGDEVSGGSLRVVGTTGGGQ